MANNKNIISNFIWRFFERIGAQLVAFVITLVIARILTPEDYGTVALITVVTQFLGVFVDSGLGTALIQKKNADQLDFSTVFYANIGLCLVAYFLLFLTSPWIADFYGEPELSLLLRVSGITLIISGVKNIQQAYVSRNLLFKRFFFSTLGGTIAAAVVGLVMAWKGFGVWALVIQSIVNPAMDTLILWITVKWRPTLEFSWKRFKELFSFGWKMLVSALLDTVYNKLRQLIIGKLYTTEDLAFYNKGEQFPTLIANNVNTSIDSVLLPVMSEAQDNASQVKDMTRRSIKMSVYIMAPLMMGMCFVATPMVRLLLTEKWLKSVPFIQIFCITYMFFPIHTANLNAIKAMGRSDLFLKLEIIKKINGFLVLFLTMRWGVMAMAYSLFYTELCAQIINSWPNKKLLNYNYLDQIKDILPSIVLAVFMGVCVYTVEYLHLNDIVTLGIQIILGAFIYILGSKIFHFESYEYLCQVIKNLLKKKRR